MGTPAATDISHSWSWNPDLEVSVRAEKLPDTELLVGVRTTGWPRYPELEDDIEDILLKPAGGLDCRGEAIAVK